MKKTQIISILVLMTVLYMIYNCVNSTQEFQYNVHQKIHPLYSSVQFHPNQEVDQITYKLPIGSNQLIGMVYPPRIGPLHTNFIVPGQKDSCSSPYAAIYDDKVVFNQCMPFVR